MFFYAEYDIGIMGDFGHFNATTDIPNGNSQGLSRRQTRFCLHDL